MLAFMAKRLAAAVPVLVGISLVGFFLIRAVPGDTVTVLMGVRYEAGEAQALRERLGLDRPLVVQYLIWLRGVLAGDLGTSATSGKPVTALIGERLPVTLELTLIALVFGCVAGLPLGLLSAFRRREGGGDLSRIAGLTGVSVPNFWLSTLLILLFSLTLHWLPSGGFVSLAEEPGENLRRYLMPGLSLGMAVMAVIMRMTRSSMLEVLGADYIRSAEGKGLGRLRVIGLHALRNGSIPIVTIVGLQAGSLLGGSIVIEQVFALPGLGRLVLQAIGSRDYALLQGILLFIGSVFVLINLIVDLFYGLLDPRVRGGEGTR